MPPNLEYIESNGIRIANEIHGHGHPLLLLTGIGYDRWFWHRVVPGLAEHYQVIAFDNRGAGASNKPDGPYTVPMMAADAIGLLQALGIERAHLFGHSLGGFIAQEIAVNLPGLVSKLVLASTNYGGPRAIPITPEALEVLTNRQGDPLDLVRRGIAIACGPGFAERQPTLAQELLDYRLANPVPPAQYQAQVMAGAGMATLTDEQVARRMARIRMPILILFGERDKVVPPANASLMAESLPAARVKMLPHAGHLFPIEAPGATVEAVVEFLG